MQTVLDSLEVYTECLHSQQHALRNTEHLKCIVRIYHICGTVFSIQAN